LYKFGIGFDVKKNKARASPFIPDLLYSGTPESIEGQDGKITSKVITSAKDFAMDISANVAGKYDASFGPSVAASMSMSHAYSV